MQDLLQRLRAMRSQKKNDEKGFTLIELLVVVVIIGILIAIAIPLYLNYQNGAKNKSSASDLRGAIATIEQCYTDNNNTFPTAIAATTGGYTLTGCSGKITSSSGTTINYAVSSGAYSVVAQQTGQTQWFCYSSAQGGSVITKSGTFPTAYQSTC